MGTFTGDSQGNLRRSTHQHEAMQILPSTLLRQQMLYPATDYICTTREHSLLRSRHALLLTDGQLQAHQCKITQLFCHRQR